MKTKLHWLFIFSLVFCTNSLLAQKTENKPQKAIEVGTLEYKYVPSIAEQIRTGTFIPAATPDPKQEVNPRQRHGADIIIGKGSTDRDPLADQQLEFKSIPGRAPDLIFTTTSSTGTPSDPTGAVGRDFYIAAWNVAWQIFDRDGTPAAGMPNPASLGTLFGGRAPGDPIALYDSAADRYIIIQFDGPDVGGSTNGFHIAISQTNDPINDGWHVYSPSDFGTSDFPDYEKMSIWHDGYYMTGNTFSPGGLIWALERDKMLSGDPTASIQEFTLPGLGTVPGGFKSPHFFNVTDDNLPTSGGATVVFQQDNDYSGVTNDHFKLWTLDIDWVTPANSMISAATEFPVTDFISVFDGGSFVNLTQPTGGSDIDALQALIANQAQFRKFGSHNSAVFCHVVDVGGGTEQAAIRWYEVRQTADGQPWTLYQEGTYVAADGRHAWNASMAMDIQGNIGMGYTTMGGTTNTMITSAYTGQMLASSGTGIMDVAEEVISVSTAGNPSSRYADYSHLTVDPLNDKGFWFDNEVFIPNRSNVVGVFQLAPDTMDDVGVISVDAPTDGALTNSETVTVTVFNFGENTASGFNVTYQVDGGATITEAFVGSLASSTSAQHVFATTADLSTEGNTYSIMSCTTLGIDEDTGNDCVTENVLHEFANDIGVIAITAPVSGEGLGNETVTVTIENFGTVAQSGFNVNYIVDGGTPVVETVAATVNPGATIVYNFAATANLSTVGTYAITSSTLLAGDSDGTNDTAATSVTNVSCQTQSNSTVQAIGPNGGTVTTSVVNFSNDFVVDDVNVTIDITHTWDGDLTITLTSPDNVTVELANQIGSSGDNYSGTVFDDEAGTAIGAGSPPYAGTFQPSGSLADFDGLQTMGDWTLSITDNANGDDGTLNNWDLQLCGNTNLSVDEALVEEGITVIYEENDHFLIKLPTSSIQERLVMNVFNVLGQQLLYTVLENESGLGYEYRLDMSYAAAGVYFVKIGNGTRSNIKRIIVK